MFRFSCKFAFFINFSSFKLDVENNANFGAVSSKRANFDEVYYFKTYMLIFRTHNLQTFKHNSDNTLINELLLIQFYLINIRSKLLH